MSGKGKEITKKMQKDMVYKYKNGESIYDIASEYGVANYRVSKIIKDSGEFKYGKKLALRGDVVKEYKENGTKPVELAKMFKISRPTVYQMLREAGIVCKDWRKPVSATLDPKEVKKMLEEGMSKGAIAKQLKTSYYRVSQCINENRVVAKETAKVKPKKMQIEEGEKLYYHIGHTNNMDNRTKVIEVIDSRPEKIVCVHKEGFKETFMKEDLVILFGNGRLRKMEVQEC